MWEAHGWEPGWESKLKPDWALPLWGFQIGAGQGHHRQVRKQVHTHRLIALACGGDEQGPC